MGQRVLDIPGLVSQYGREKYGKDDAGQGDGNGPRQLYDAPRIPDPFVPEQQKTADGADERSLSRFPGPQ